MHIGECGLDDVEKLKSPSREHGCLSMGQNQPEASKNTAKNNSSITRMQNYV